MQQTISKTGRTRILFIILALLGCAVIATWVYTIWMDSPRTITPKKAVSVQKIVLNNPLKWCVRAALGQLLTTSVMTVVAFVAWMKAFQNNRRWPQFWTVYVAVWLGIVIMISCSRYINFSNGKETYALRNAPLMSKNSLDHLLAFFFAVVLIPLLIYTVGIWSSSKNFWISSPQTVEFRVFLYVTMIGLIINGFFWEPSTWRVPKSGGGLENMFGRFETYCEYIIGWHLRNHPLLIISILAVRSFFTSHDTIVSALSSESKSTVVDAIILNQIDENPYRNL